MFDFNYIFILKTSCIEHEKQLETERHRLRLLEMERSRTIADINQMQTILNDQIVRNTKLDHILDKQQNLFDKINGTIYEFIQDVYIRR